MQNMVLWLEVESMMSLSLIHSCCKVLSVTDTINGYDSITEEVLVTDEVDPGTEKARKELEAVSYTHLDVYKRQM